MDTVPGGLSTSAAARREKRVGWVCAIAVLLVWVLFQLAGRFSTKQSLTPWDVTALRHVGALLSVLPICLWRGLPHVPRRQAAAIVATSAFGFPIGAYVGFSIAPVALGAVILFGALPIVTAIAGRALFGERLTRARLASLPVIAGGILLIGAETVGHTPTAGRGALCFLLATTCLAVFTLLIRRWQISALDAMVTLSLFGAPIYLPIWWLFLPSTLAAASAGAIVTQMVMQGAVTAVLAMFLYSRAVNALGSGPPTLVAAMVPGPGVAGSLAAAGGATRCDRCCRGRHRDGRDGDGGHQKEGPRIRPVIDWTLHSGADQQWT